ncbi:probable auxin efflux carrier component 9 [Typha latifolia]|uniref:probable auxin efflux carrier component 9 n=1 Tax=Typha latifolia TaxID=4733 RepID=UPI003C2C9EDE
MMPLYAAMALGYASVRWWRAFTSEQCAGINHFVALFAVPLLIFRMIASNNPYKMAFRLIAADSLQKVVVLAALLGWAYWANRRRSPAAASSLSWVVTLFSLATLPNTVIMGVPVLTGMYGPDSRNLMVQIVVFQMCVWYNVVVFLYEYMAASRNFVGRTNSTVAPTPLEVIPEESFATGVNCNAVAVSVSDGDASVTIPVGDAVAISISDGDDTVANGSVTTPKTTALEVTRLVSPPPMSVVLVMAMKKLMKIPSTHASFLGLIWSLIAFRLGIKMPTIIDDSLSIISTTAIGLSMFSVGTFMARQSRFISCGYMIAVISMAIRFLVGPAIMAATSLTVGLHGNLLHVGIVQAALPLAVLSFVYGEEYKVHPDIMSTGVIVGIFISVPVTILYYILLEL